MIRKVITLGILTAGLTFTVARGIPLCGRLVSSAHNFEQCFSDLKNASGNTNPIERLMFSLLLANGQVAPTGR
jgi:hypothetical protein